MLRKSLCLLLFASALCRAEEKSREEWVKELTATYAKLDGFTAVYQSRSEDMNLDGVMGLDERSGLAVLHLVATKDGKKAMEIKQWNTDHDELFADAGDRLMKFTGINTELSSLGELAKLFKLDDDHELFPRLQTTPTILIGKRSVDPAFALVGRDLPPWRPIVDQLSVKGADEKTVTFESEERGTIVISRENGLLVRQSLTTGSGKLRVLELAEVRLNPGKEEVVRIANGWKSEGAELMARGAMLGSLRMMVFQLLIRAVEEGQTDLEKLEARLEEQREALRRLGEGWTSEVGGALAGEDIWKKMLDEYRRVAEKKYREEKGATDEEVGKFVDKFLALGSIRELVRDKLANEMVGIERMREIFLFELGGKNRDAKLLTAKTKAGEAAKKAMEIALFRAYCEAVLEKKMTKYWGERQGLD